jgi:hypothetical protein
LGVQANYGKEHDMRRKLRRLREIWAELNYAQRRLLEIRTGVPIVTPAERARFSPHGR